MTKSYEQVLKEIEVLEKQAETLRKSELAKAIVDVRNLIRKYKLTIDDLGLKAERKKRLVKNTSSSKRQSTSKKRLVYISDTDPKDTYGGRGPLPAWLKKKIEEGRSKEEFLVK